MPNPANMRRVCATFQAIEDGVAENVEKVDLLLAFSMPPENVVIIQPNITRVQIVSTDGKVILFRLLIW